MADEHRYSDQEVLNKVLNDALSTINMHYYSGQEVLNIVLNDAGTALKVNIAGTSTETITTTNNTVTTIDTIALGTDVAALFVCEIIASRQDAAYKGGFKFTACFANDDGTITRQGSIAYAFRNRPGIALLPKWKAYFTIDGTDILVQVKGNNGHTINWKSHTECLEI